MTAPRHSELPLHDYDKLTLATLEHRIRPLAPQKG